MSYKKIIDFLQKEILFFITLLIFIITWLYTKKVPYISFDEFKVLFILFMLFSSIKGLEESKLIEYIAYKIEQGSYIATKLILGTFFISMFLTNDVSLVAIIPLTLSLNIEKKALIVILEAVSANAGSALTPFGNPQNLFIYWHYHLNILEFLKIIYPFVFFNFILLLIISFYINPKKSIKKQIYIKIDIKNSLIFTVSLFAVILTILHILPLIISFLIVAISLIFNPKALKIDYFLLLTFLLFFIITNNLSPILSKFFSHFKDIFLTTIISSAFISNVPTTLLFAKFTNEFKALLWGVSVGAFAGLIGSLANLIAYKLYINRYKKENFKFFLKLVYIKSFFLFASIVLYYIILKIEI